MEAHVACTQSLFPNVHQDCGRDDRQGGLHNFHLRLHRPFPSLITYEL